MDPITTEFFNTAHAIEHNTGAKKTPAEFLNCSTDKEIADYFNWIRYHSNCGSLKLDISQNTNEIKNELIKISSLGVLHRSGNSDGWRSITLFGHSSIMTSSTEYYISQGLITANDVPRWTDIAQFTPKTVQWIKENIPITDYSRIRVMIVDPNGFIQPHIDNKDGPLFAANIHVAIAHPAGTEFALGNSGVIPWKEGESRTFDIGRAHSVRNLSDQARIHLLISPKNGDWGLAAMKLICDNYTKFQQEIK